MVDAIATAVALVVAVTVAVDASFPGRAVVALVFFVGVPGWVALRCCRLPGSSLAAFCAIGASTAGTLLLGQVLVLATDWAWRPVTVAVASAAVVGGIVLLVRR